MNSYLIKSSYLFFLLFTIILSHAQVTDTYTTATTWTVPAGITSITIKVYGGGAGTGGQDCGAGCSNAAAGPVGYVLADYSVTPGDVIGIYPGSKGSNGGNSVSGTGGGSGGADTYPSLNFNGGNGGNAGNSGSSGGGGGGGAASVITINSTIKIVAGGAGGGGGMANMANSGLVGSSSTSSNGINNGGNGTTPGGDGGGGGGGGGGQFASVGGGVHAAGGESAGNGGFMGSNSVSGATSVTTNGNIAWTNTGQIEITHGIVLPVTWLSFTATEQSSSIVLNWSTATEQNTKDYKIQHSINGANWNDIGMVPAAGTSTTVQQYGFIDQNPGSGLNYYRLLQRDLDNKISYSKVVLVDLQIADRMLKIYPNPVLNGTITVRLKQSSTVQIYNSIGLKVMQKEFSAGEHLFNLLKLSTGTYYIKANDDVVLFVIQ
jgi:hypothetical protein